MDSDAESDFYGIPSPHSQRLPMTLPRGFHHSLYPRRCGAVARLESRVASFDAVASLDEREEYLRYMPRKRRVATASNPNSSKHGSPDWVRQPHETVDGFVTRLPPASSGITPDLPWIHITNPSLRHPRAPVDQRRFDMGGRERLDILLRAMPVITASGERQFVIVRNLNTERAAATKSLLALAEDCGIVGGKWMLFPAPGEVNQDWQSVARATANDELGPAAKVAPRDPANPERDRVICVYTRDFRDRQDIARVLRRPHEMGLVRPGGRQIYYKTDAWSHLRIYSDNKWGLSARMYSSAEGIRFG